MNDSPEITIGHVRTARERIKSLIHRTPVITSSSLDAQAGCQLFFKCENFQRTGAFKARGAFNTVFSLSDAEAARGVVTSSSGNQGAAVALAAKERGVPAYVAMPRSAVKAKVTAIQRYGGHIVWIETKGQAPTTEEYDATVAGIQAQTGAYWVHSHNSVLTIAGQGTCALEFLEERADLDVLLAPVGGGGLLSGTALTAKALRPRVRVVGCEPQMANDAQQSFRAKRLIPQLNPRTLADGLRTSLGDLTFPLILQYVDDIVTVSEEAIASAMRLAWETLKIVIEPSSAVPLAAVLEKRVPVEGQRVGIIVTGGNVDLDRLPWMHAS